MTINEMNNCNELMSQITKERSESCKDVPTHISTNQLPSIVISPTVVKKSSHASSQHILANVVSELDSNVGSSVCNANKHNLHDNSKSGGSQNKFCLQSLGMEQRTPSEKDQFDLSSPPSSTVVENQQKMSVHIESDCSPENENSQINQTEMLNIAVSRPTSLTSTLVSLNTPKPPEFSISPADSGSKTSSNENAASSYLTTNFKAPPSPSSLSVNLCYGNGNGNMVLSPSFTSLQGSLASSINDLTVEAEQLERAIRQNDVKFVNRMLDMYLGKNPSDKFSQSSRRSSNQEIKNERPTLQNQQTFDEHTASIVNKEDIVSIRRESGSTETRENLTLFTNALHLAIENNAYDVAVLLLKNGIDPNEPGVAPCTIDFWRRSSHTSEDSNVQHNAHGDRLHTSNLNLINTLSASREPLLVRTPSIRTPMLLSPQTSNTMQQHQQHLSLYFSVNSSPSSINSDLSSMCHLPSPTKLIKLRPEMSTVTRTVYTRGDGTHVSYEEEYNRERLFTLPPIYLAVALNNSTILRELIHFGANVNITDNYEVTPLHLCLCQEHISRACLQLLVQSGAKMYAKNKQSLAPYELVDQELTEEMLYLQKFIIDNSFSQLLPVKNKYRLSQRETAMYDNYKSLERNLFEGSNSSSVNQISFSGKKLNSKEESVDSCGSGFNISRYFDPDTPGGEVSSLKKKVQIESMLATHDTVHTCLEDFSQQATNETVPAPPVPPLSAPAPTTSSHKTNNAAAAGGGVSSSGGSSLFFSSTISNLMGHKRSFACDSNPNTTNSGSYMKNCNLSQSTQYLAGCKEGQFGISRGTTTQQSPLTTQQHSTIGSGMGTRLFGRRRSGDESFKSIPKQSSKQTATAAMLSRTNTQEDGSRTEENFVKSVETSMAVLCKMACNIECVRLVIGNLQHHLPEIISLNESQNTLWKLHSGLACLFDRCLQTIVNNFLQCQNKITHDRAGNCQQNLLNKANGQSNNTVTTATTTEVLEDVTLSVLCLKQEMATQLCGLMICALQCLKGGQTFQYSSLLVVNLIIDAFIRYECSTIPLDRSKVFERESELMHTEQMECCKLVGTGNEKFEKHSSAITAAAGNIGKHIRNLRINDSFNFKQNLANRDDKSKQFAVAENKSKTNEQHTVSKKTSESRKLISWIKTVHLSPRIGQHKQLNMIDELIQNSNKTRTEDTPKKSGTVDECRTEKSLPGQMKNVIFILIHEGLDLILNVLNNAITLHKRVSGSKHSCVPSKRSRHCIYHCLQILAARAILYASQCDEAQKRLVKEGPLKVLIASIDSTHDPQLICLALQAIANLSINPCYHQKLVEAEIVDCLMQLILPSDEWFYTNHSTKYAKFVKHQAARIMVYMGFEKRLRNKVYLFDLLEDLGLHSPLSESLEDSYIMQTSVTPSAVYSPNCPTLLIGSSVEAIILDLLKQVEDKIINGEDSQCVDPLNDENYFMDNTPDTRTIKDPPAIQVDLPSGLIGDRRITNQHPNCFFYLSTLPMAMQPIIILRLLQHRMFGCISYWAWHSNAVSRASVASAGGSSIEYNRSRASSTVSNANFEIQNAFNLKRNMNLHCSNSSLSPGRIEVDRRPSVKGLMDNRLTLQNSLPLTVANLHRGVRISSSLSTIGQNNTSVYGSKLPVQSTIQRKSLVEQQMHQNCMPHMVDAQSVDSPTDSPTANKRFRFSSLRRNRHSLSTESTSPGAPARNNSLDASERNEAYIMAFQRELQNLPKMESPTPEYSASQAALTNSLVSIVREAFERSGTPLKRPRSCSVPRITLENFSSTLLQLPANVTDKMGQVATCPVSSLMRSATADVSCSNSPALASGTSPSLSPIKMPIRNLNESPISYTSTVRSTSRSGSRSGSAGQVMTDSIMPNVHKSILKLMLDWVNLCPNDFHQSTTRRELIDFLNRVSSFGDNYRWLAEEIRMQANIDDTENLVEQPSCESLINKEYQKLQNLILSGKLPCSKEEAAILAVIQLRIEETSPQSKDNDNHHTISSMLPNAASLRQNSIIDEKLRPICEDVKETSPLENDTPIHLASMNMSSSFDELEEDEQDELEGKEKPLMHSGSLLAASKAASGSACHEDLSAQSFLPSLTKTTSRLCHWMSSNWASQSANFSSIDLRQCLPPMYHNTKNIVKTIKEQKRKLFHTPIYESEQQLKKLYIQTCKRLPAFGCRIFQVKELLHGKTNRRATRLLGICLERIVLLDSKTLQPAKIQSTTNLQQWRTGGGRSHDRLELEFRGTKWSFVTPSIGSLNSIGMVLWEIMQDLDSCFLDTLIAGQRSDSHKEEHNRTKLPAIDYYDTSKGKQFREELQLLESLLHFPEEVALRLTEVEHKLFYHIEPVHYIRQVTVELSPPCNRSCIGDTTDSAKLDNPLTVKELIERFNEVSSWITHIIISQPTHEMRKAVLSCIMRVVQTCWNLGNFNTAVEILAGLKSEKLKPFWLSIEQKEQDQPFLRKRLSHILLTLEEPSDEYKSAVIRALDIPHSKVVPFFGAFLRDLKTILQRIPSLIVLAPENNSIRSGDAKTHPLSTRIDSVSEFNGEDNYMSRIGVGGIINMEKMYQTHQVLDNIRTFHIHAIRRIQLLAMMKGYENELDKLELRPNDMPVENGIGINTSQKQCSPNRLSTTSSSPNVVQQENENEQLYLMDLDTYRPIQPLLNSHGISLIPLDVRSIDFHNLQAMHHGMTTIHFEEDTGRSSIVFLQLEQSNSTLAWCKPYWSALFRASGNTPQDFQLAADIEESVLPGITVKYETKEAAMIGLDEGFIDLMFLKEIVVGQCNVELSFIGRRHGLTEYILTESEYCSMKLLFGVNLSDNRITEFLAPRHVATLWVEGLRSVLQLIQKQKKLCDQRVLWLKEKYLQLYYKEGLCKGPIPADAIRVFGGRKWTLETMGASHQSLQIDPSNANKQVSSSRLRKKKSTVSLSVIRDYSTRSQLSINSEPDAAFNSLRSSQQSPQHGGKAHKLSNRSHHGPTIQHQSDKNSEQNTHNSQSSLSGKSTSSCEITKSAIFDYSPIHTSLLTSHYRERFCKKNPTNLLDTLVANKLYLSTQKTANDQHQSHSSRTKMAITHSSNIDFIEFFELFRSFLICIRRDIKDIFEQIASKSDIHTNFSSESNCLDDEFIKHSRSSGDIATSSKSKKESKFLGLLTRNTNFDQREDSKRQIYDAIASASIVTNSAGVDSMKTSVLTATDFYAFITTYQGEDVTLDETKRLIQLHEPNSNTRKRGCLSFEGFARYLMDKDNYAYTPELNKVNEDEMDYPLSHYYIASSHNTYLTGHQLKGESSVELYSQVLLTGCRCVELDCWDGDDGMPLIYHGHTLTSKIPFKKVVETINEKAFVASPYPVILSVENHCSLQQQAKMAQIFLSVFGDKLVTKFLFESDYYDEPQLPTPKQLKYCILIKNKKLRAPLHPSLNFKTRNMVALTKGTNGRTNSLVSNVSTGSLNDDEDDDYDDEDDDEEVDDQLQTTALEVLADRKQADDSELASSSKNKSSYKSKSGHISDQHNSQDAADSSHAVINTPFAHSKVVRKSSSQIAPELSDLVIYCQAIKFRGLLNSTFNLSPTNSTIATPIAKKISSRKVLSSTTFNSTIQASASLLPVIESNKIKEELRELNTASPTFQSVAGSAVSMNKRPNSSAPCYQVSSINENTAKKLCRKSPLAVIAHTESQIMRTYPAGMRIDSSNFNPVIFWAFGIQSVALNYQTVDMALHINSAMFEQNGNCGYVLKTDIMRDRSHMMFGRFNPWEKEFDGLHTINLTITVISGQYICPNTNTGSPQIDVEIVGIPVDCCRQRTKLVQRNSLNPIFNDTFFFRIKFVDLAFLRMTVTDMGTNHVAAQRIIPIKCLKQGYRHMRLHNSQNQRLPLSSLFIYSSYEEEGLDIESSDKWKAKHRLLSKIELNRPDCNRIDATGTAPVKRRMFFLVVHGVMPEEPSTILKITQDSTVNDVILQALTKANKSQENVNDYVLLEEVNRSWEKKRIGERNTVTQRLLDPNERPLEAQSNWKGEGRFIMKKMADDPSTRAWMTSIRSSSANKERNKRQDHGCVHNNEEVIADWAEEPENETFLVCIYNVSEEQPYTILKASVASSAQDIITHALLKAHRNEDPKSFVIVEEVENFGDTNPNESVSTFSFKNKSGIGYRRVLGDHENVYDVQSQWKNKGKFELKYHKDITSNDNTFMKNNGSSKLLRSRGSFKKLSQIHRSYSKRLQKKDCPDSPGSIRKSSTITPTPTTPTSTPTNTKQRQEQSAINDQANERADKNLLESNESRQTHSEGEMPSDSEEKNKDSAGSLSRLKKLSLKRLKVWKS